MRILSKSLKEYALAAMDQDTTDWFKDPDFAATYIVASDDASKLSAVQLAQVGSYI